ncbi:hypothetical protein CAMRE0001_2982 [Campylobacter rectus RM3267]|uniref:Uncharacterized protein n=1 Tax=Campylobacter rectus RM3267 TaxID=553218 RepID=B9D5T9_CAMRE|nr:hypothetical protein CAMRE0001_2982 [Campylobacter rectus RM3267]
MSWLNLAREKVKFEQIKNTRSNLKFYAVKIRVWAVKFD